MTGDRPVAMATMPRQHSIRTFRKDLEDMMASVPHDIEHFVNKAEWNSLVEQVTHAVHKNPATRAPFKG
jgi:hypothetical protein